LSKLSFILNSYQRFYKGKVGNQFSSGFDPSEIFIPILSNGGVAFTNLFVKNAPSLINLRESADLVFVLELGKDL
jgi:hypothetical protein